MPTIKEEALSPKFGKWWKYIRPFWEREGFDSIYEKIKKDAQRDKIFPSSDNTYRAFFECPPELLNLIIISMEPYSGTYYDNNLPQATGLCLDCSNSSDKLQPSLISFWDGLFSEYNEPAIYEKDLSFLAHQGVLMGNRSLVVKKGKIGSCLNYFDKFWEFFITEVITSYFPSVPFLLLGKDAEKLRPHIFEMSNPVHVLSHPSYAARSQQLWDTKGTFKKLNNYIVGNTGEANRIYWNKKELEAKINEVPF